MSQSGLQIFLFAYWMTIFEMVHKEPSYTSSLLTEAIFVFSPFLLLCLCACIFGRTVKE